MRLQKSQKSALLEWVAAGLESGQINRLAGEFDPRFSVSRAQVDYYRKTRKVNIKELSESGEVDALVTGLSQKGERVKRLQLLAAMMEEDLFGGVLWTEQVKSIGSGFNQERIEYEEFNAGEVQQYRGLLDDIAREVGGRIQKVAPTTPDGENPYMAADSQELIDLARKIANASRSE